MELTYIITHQRSNIKYNTRCLRINSLPQKSSVSLIPSTSWSRAVFVVRVSWIVDHHRVCDILLLSSIVVKSFPWYHRPLVLRSFSWIVDSHHVRFWGAVIVQCEICCVRLMRNWKLWKLVMVFYSFEMYMDEYFNNHLLCVGKMLFSYGWTMWRKKPPARKDGLVCGWILKKPIQ